MHEIHEDEATGRLRAPNASVQATKAFAFEKDLQRPM